MARGVSPKPEALACSFCHKSQGAVAKLISSPSDSPRTYICDECIAVCVAILNEDRKPPEPDTEIVTPTGEPHPLLAHPLASPLLAAIENWIKRESLGGDAAAHEFAEVRRIAVQMVGG